MPSKSRAQQRFFGLVHSLQKGETDPAKVSRAVRAVAKVADKKSVREFSSAGSGDLSLKLKMEMLSILKEFQEPTMLKEGNTNPIAKEFTKTGIYDQFIQKFVGLPFSQKELESIGNYTDVKPSKIEKNQVRYESSDPFNNNTTTVVKKLREGSQFAYTAFSKYSQTTPDEKPADKNPTQESPPGAGQPGEAPAAVSTGPQPEDIIVAKSISFTDDIAGSKILSDFIRKLDL